MGCSLCGDKKEADLSIDVHKAKKQAEPYKELKLTRSVSDGLGMSLISDEKSEKIKNLVANNSDVVNELKSIIEKQDALELLMHEIAEEI